tara:strand:- start:383 stop:1027 length:645 start_codon:yes stop_codon:yes gene_type:complete
LKRSEKAEKIINILEELYPVIHIPLDHVNTYTFLIAVMLSAQSTDKKVNEITPALFKRAKSPYEMIKLSVIEIQEYIREIGLAPTKAKNVRKMSEQLIESHGGVVPSTFEELESLAGVGHKTASVIMSQAFGHPAFPVDTHIHRLAARWGLSSGKNVVKTENDLKSIFPKEKWHKLHLQIIFFGREYCPARNHDLTNCPICGWAASKKRIKEES